VSGCTRLTDDVRRMVQSGDEDDCGDGNAMVGDVDVVIVVVEDTAIRNTRPQ